MDYKNYFKNKKITVMGLGLLGRGVGDTAFLAKCGAKLTVTDLKTEEQLKESLYKLRKYKNIKFVLGEHRLEDFRNCDMVLKAAGVPLNSPYIKKARKNKIPVEMSSSLFMRLAGMPIIGITGTRGKSTVAYLINHILKLAGKRVLLGGNVLGVSTLSFLPKAKQYDYAVLELDSWQLQGFGDSRISPHISVFTTFMDDHLNYYKGDRKKYFADKSNIFKYQKKDDLLIVGNQAYPFIKKYGGKIKSKLVVAKESLPKGWKINLPGKHNEYNARFAVEVARSLWIPDTVIKKALTTFSPVPGRLELIREIKGIKIYNDNNSTTPDATIAGLRAFGLGKQKKIILIMGGDEKNLDMSLLIKEIPKYCSKVVLFKERGTERIKKEVFSLEKKEVQVYEEEGLDACVGRAFSVAHSGESILYSPAFSSFGKYFKNEYDRGGQFVELIKKLK